MNARREAVKRCSRDMVAHLRMLATTRPSDTAIIVAEADVETRIDYAELDIRVRALASYLQSRFERGNRVLLLLDNDDSYVVAFFACLYAGLIAVPAAAPETAHGRHLERLRAIADDAKPQCILGSNDVLVLINKEHLLDDGIAAVAVDVVSSSHAEAWKEHVPGESDIAFLQYTSGSTSAPKGVVISHGNLMANERAIEAAMAIGADDCFVSWLPLFHDMGLVGGLLQPIHRGIPLVLASPSYFLQQPLRWLQLISHHRATISGGPDFAYRLCLERVTDAQLRSLDLSSWRVAFSGAEPVRYDTLQAFAERFKDAGFNAQAIYPCYGLAEATLFVTGGRRSSGMTSRTYSHERLATGRVEANKVGTTLVGCGAAQPGHHVRITDPDTGLKQTPTRVGEIWVSGPSVSRGYWKKEAETAESFVEQDGKHWLRTGDLGFVQHKQLYITGRRKDLIILRGHNIYPQDIERGIESEIEAVRKGRVAAFAVQTSAGEGIGIAVEISRSLQKLVPVDRLIGELSAVVSSQCQEAPTVVVLLNPGALPKTSSGKVQRSACHEGWLARSLDAFAIYEHGRFVLGSSSADSSTSEHDDLERELGVIWRYVLKTHEVPTADRSFLLDGGNSLSVAELVASIHDKWHIELSVRTVYERPRLRELAAEVRRTLSRGEQAVTPIATLSPMQRGRPLPASQAQSQQWLLAHLNPTSTAYHLALGLQLRGSLDVEALRRSLSALVERHESLRTTFATSSAGEIEQMVQPVPKQSLPLIDLRAATSALRSDQVAECIETITRPPFDLMRAPLLRTALIQLSDAEHILIMAMHHIAGDGWSARILVEELAELYAARIQEREPQLREVTVQYADYAQWQRGWLASPEREKQLAYWREQLGSTHPVLELPMDQPRVSSLPPRTARHEFALSESLVQRLRQRAHESHTTLFTVLLSAFQALLHRYTGQTDIRVGVPVTNRSRPETHSTVGLFANTQVLRSEIDGRLPLSELLARVKHAVIGAQAHQELPFDQLVEALQPVRSANQHPLFQVMMNHQPALRLPAFPGLQVERYPVQESHAPFDLILRTTEEADGRVVASFVHAADVFGARTIARLEEHFRAMLHALADEPVLAVGEVPLRNDEVTSSAISSIRSNSFEPAYLRISRCAERLRDRPALRCDGVTLSFQALDQWSDEIAARLSELRVAPEARIGLCVERSVAMVAALLGIWKSGAAFVPLDPSYPAERLSYMSKDAHLSAVVIDTVSEQRCGDALASCAHVRVDARDRQTARSLPKTPPHSQQLAYVIYTSGSTGRPKGVAITHGALALHLDDFIGHYGITEADTLLHSSTINFDVALHELLPALMMGGQVVMRGPQMWTLESLGQTLRETDVTFARIPTAFWQQWLHTLPAALPRLRQITVGGEALPGDALGRWFRGPLHTIPVDNLYGPTETTVACMAHRCQAADAEFHTVPIGKAYASRTAHVLDPDGNIAPVGGIGELCIAGETLARGYLDRPGLTAERFIADPQGEGGRLYRTGDLSRERAGDVFEYLGRLDRQVKLRGHRIELGEVEVALRRCANVREAVVEPRGEDERRQLVAYVVGEAEPAALRTELLDRLPDYMVPTAFVVMKDLPLNASGKVDRKSLPAPALANDRGYEAPQGAMEALVALIWGEALNAERVGRHDNFFDLGGHSLLLLKVHARLQAQLEQPPAIVDLFKYPTVSGLAAFLQRGDLPRSSQKAAERAQRQRKAFLAGKRHVERVLS